MILNIGTLLIVEWEDRVRCRTNNKRSSLLCSVLIICHTFHSCKNTGRRQLALFLPFDSHTQGR